MASTTMIASSMTRPTATAMPPSDMMLRLCPKARITRKVDASTTGTTAAATTPRAHVPERQPEHHEAQEHAERDGVAHARHALFDERRLVVHGRERHAARKRPRHVARGDRARPRPRPRCSPPRRATPRAAPSRRRGRRRRSGGRGVRRRRAPRCRARSTRRRALGDGHRGEVGEVARLRRHHRGRTLRRELEAPRGGQREALAEPSRDIARSKVEPRDALGVEQHLDLAEVTAEHAHRPTPCTRERAGRTTRSARSRRSRESTRPVRLKVTTGKGRGREALGLELEPRGQRVARGGHLRLHELERAPHVGAGREGDRHLARAAEGARVHALHAERRREALLEGPRHGALKHVGRRVATARHHHDARKVDLGIDPRGRAGRGTRRSRPTAASSTASSTNAR